MYSNDFYSILTRLLQKVDDHLDKRQGSIIYDALAPAAMELAECYIALDIYTEQTYLKTASGENLDNRVADYGLIREPATKAIRIAEIYNTDNELYDIPLNTRFSIPEEYGGYNYTVIEKIETGKYKLECETAGSVGNEYLGVLLPLYNIESLGRAEIIGTFRVGEDIEDDESLRKRAIAKLNPDAFGGNQADYRRYLQSIEGVGPAKIFPVWDGGGTVKVSFLNSDYSTPSNEFINQVQTLIDPIKNHAEGLGMAPIGHTVTVVAPTDVQVTMNAELVLLDNITILDVQDKVNEAIQDYIKEVQKNWQDSLNSLTIYTSRVIASILTVEGIVDVSTLTINGKPKNLILTQDAQLQQFPRFVSIGLTGGV